MQIGPAVSQLWFDYKIYFGLVGQVSIQNCDDRAIKMLHETGLYKFNTDDDNDIDIFPKSEIRLVQVILEEHFGLA